MQLVQQPSRLMMFENFHFLSRVIPTLPYLIFIIFEHLKDLDDLD